MKLDEFEQKLTRQALRQVPTEWRGEILSAAREVRSGDSAERRPIPVSNGGFLPKAATPAWLENLLWPHPKAWAALAAVWILIVAVDFSVRDKVPIVAERSAPLLREEEAKLNLEHRVWAELIGAGDIIDVDRSKLWAPQPRSQRVYILMT